ncbi:MAG: hypothetical protein WBD22_05400 [Pyrinomonadaceae bacterium]
MNASLNGLTPPRAIPGGEIGVICDQFRPGQGIDYACIVDGNRCHILGASASRVLAIVPDIDDSQKSKIWLVSNGKSTNKLDVAIGARLASDMHMVANPAIDPNDNSIILTRSGPRGQQLPATLFRLERNGTLGEIPVEILNPTGLAFDEAGELFVTNRADGELSRITGDVGSYLYASNLGVPTGIAIDERGLIYVGDRGGTIYRISKSGDFDKFAVLEPSVSAYHLAFGPDGRLYVSAPGLASFDSIYAVDPDGTVSRYFRGLGRPQGLAFDTKGNLYVAACFKGSRGIVRISPGGSNAELFVAGMNVVGLCFSRGGEMIVAASDAVYSLDIGIKGTLLSDDHPH